MRKLFCLSVLVALSLSVGSGGAADSSFDVRVSVPTVCSVTYMTPLQQSGENTVRINEVREFCNASGYEIYLEYPAGTLEGATVQLGGQSTTLNGSGRDLIATSNVAAHRVSTFALLSPAPFDGGVAFAINMQPR